jgi:hypothetical protein
MCARTTCNDCGKPDWRGCGAHVESVLRDVPAQARCRCREDGTRKPPPSLGDMLSSLFGRKS